MRMIILAAALAATPAAAQTTLVDACQRAAEHYWSVETSSVSDVQEFSELSPPRVRMRVAVQIEGAVDRTAALLGADAAPRSADMGTVTCEFTDSVAPFGLASFCPPEGCWLLEPSRLQEIQTLMQRDGL